MSNPFGDLEISHTPLEEGVKPVVDFTVWEEKPYICTCRSGWYKHTKECEEKK